MPPTTRAVAAKQAAVTDHIESDYGSDLDDDTITDLLTEAESQPLDSVVIESIEQHNPLPVAVKIPSSPANREHDTLSVLRATPPARRTAARDPSVEVEYFEGNRRAFSPRILQDDTTLIDAVLLDPSISPLERFRTPPKKPLSVTDIVSPSWCELQYFYSLAKYGKVKKTPAMRQGSKVHEKLEREVHVAVPVDVVSKEDVFGLRIWNVIQGLRTLRATGMTRELEVWGLLEGQVVNGVIDEIGFACPDQELETALEEGGRKRGKGGKKEVEAGQGKLDGFVTDANGQPRQVEEAWKVYITDVKTRTSSKVPTDPVSLRPTYLQLMIYRELLLQLASGDLEAYDILSRYNINGYEAFSDSFIAQVGGLDYNFASSTQTNDGAAPPFSSTEDSVDELLKHNTPNTLWDLMTSEAAKTIPTLPKKGDKSPVGGISKLLRAEYRASQGGEILGSKVFVADDRKLTEYIKDEMSWWKGERPVRGVEIEEAFKCRICSFAEGCKWRIEKVEMDVQKSRLKKEGRRKSEI